MSFDLKFLKKRRKTLITAVKRKRSTADADRKNDSVVKNIASHVFTRKTLLDLTTV
jgi:hypothetical protein